MKDPRDPASPSTGDEYAETIKAVLQGTTPKDAPGAARPKPRRRLSKGAWALLFVALATPYAVWDNYRYFQHPGPPPVETQERAARVMMFSAAQAVEQHRRQRGSLPADLGGLVLPRADWRYVRTDTGYVLTVTLPGTSLTYRSGEDFRQLIRDAGVR